MTLFWLLGALIAAVALALAARPLWRRRAAGAVSREAMNAAVYRDQLRELGVQPRVIHRDIEK